jgi:hypothetical protein
VSGSTTAEPTGPTWVTVPDIAEHLGIPVTRVHQLVRERQILAVRQGGILRIPAEFVADGLVVKGLPGTLTLLADAGYSDEETLTWLWQQDDSLPGNPITALRENRMREVHRRAQAAGF